MYCVGAVVPRAPAAGIVNDLDGERGAGRFAGETKSLALERDRGETDALRRTGDEGGAPAAVIAAETEARRFEMQMIGGEGPFERAARKEILRGAGMQVSVGADQPGCVGVADRKVEIVRRGADPAAVGHLERLVRSGRAFGGPAQAVLHSARISGRYDGRPSNHTALDP